MQSFAPIYRRVLASAAPWLLCSASIQTAALIIGDIAACYKRLRPAFLANLIYQSATLHHCLIHPLPRLAACLLAWLLCCAPMPAQAQQVQHNPQNPQNPQTQPGNASDHDRARAAAQAGKILPLPKVLDSIRPNYPGEVLDIDLEQSGERWFYEIKLLQAGGQLRKLIVDASTGAVLLDRVPLGRRWRRYMQANESGLPTPERGLHRRNGCTPSDCTASQPLPPSPFPPHRAPKP